MSSAAHSNDVSRRTARRIRPASTDPLNSYDYDNWAQFRLLDCADIATVLDLVVDTHSCFVCFSHS